MQQSIYQRFNSVKPAKRTWPDKQLKQAPTWCSLDLTQGNNALSRPMDLATKMEVFKALCQLGFKHIEIAQPAQSASEYSFVRRLVELNLIPDDVTVSLLCQMKTDDIICSLNAAAGMKRFVINLYQSTSQLSREEIFALDAKGIVNKINKHVDILLSVAKENNCLDNLQLEITTEGFNTTEPELMLELINLLASKNIGSKCSPLIINLDAEVERDLPNVLADQVEYLIQQCSNTSPIEFAISVHNDRGCANACAELAQLAGVSRVKGSLFGLGERAGIIDLLVLALNCYTLGIDPKLNLANIPQLVADYELVTEQLVSPRHPYVGNDVFSTFVSHHQYAIDKAYQKDSPKWQVPYLIMDPEHIGRRDAQIIRVSTQSGRTGIAQVLKKYYGLYLPRGMQNEFSDFLKEKAASLGQELSVEQIWQYFYHHYFSHTKPLELKTIHFEKNDKIDANLIANAVVSFSGSEHQIAGIGKGALESFIAAIANEFNFKLKVIDYRQHALSEKSGVKAVCYLLIEKDSHQQWGIGIDDDSTLATLRAVVCSINRLLR